MGADEIIQLVACATQDIVAKAVAAFRAIAEEKAVALTPHIGSTTPASIDTNPDEVHQILTTMLKFAIDRCEANGAAAESNDAAGKVELRVDLEHGGVEFALSDSGETLDAARRSPSCSSA